MELRDYQKEALKNIKQEFEIEGGNRCAVVLPTGCGKSFITLQYILDNKDKRTLFLSPSHAINHQIQEHIRNLGFSRKDDFPNLHFNLYQGVNLMSAEDIARLRPDIIIMDEAHRIGAPEWGTKLEKLLEVYPSAKVLGLTATPDRMDGKNVIEDTFNNNKAIEITLTQAFARGYLKFPKYINAIYSFKDDIDSLQNKIDNIENDQKREEIQAKLEIAKKSLQNAEGLPEIFEKHMSKTGGKYIVFCQNKEHMDEMMEESKEWVKNVDSNPTMYSVYNKDGSKANEDTIKAFENDNSEHLKLLFSLQMLNEGVHVKDISGVIMLRTTKSNIIYKQQLGRALSANDGERTVIFDIVNNSKKIQDSRVLVKEILKERENTRKQGLDTNTSEEINIDDFDIIDNVREIEDLLSEIDRDLSKNWYSTYNELKEFIEKNGRKPSQNSKENKERSLVNWIDTQRRTGVLFKNKNKNDDEISEEDKKKIQLLVDLGLDKNQNEIWNNRYNKVKEFIEKNGRNPSINSKEKEEKKLGEWISTQKKGVLFKSKDKNDDEISEEDKEKIQLLMDLGLDKNLNDIWNDRYNEVKEFIEKNLRKPNFLSKEKEERKLWQWIETQKKGVLFKNKDKNDDEISEEDKKKIQLLIDLGLDKNKDDIWNDRYNEVKEFIEKNGRNPIKKAKEKEEKKLGSWIKTQKSIGVLFKNKDKKAEEISEEDKEKIQLLAALGIVIKPSLSKLEEQKQELTIQNNKAKALRDEYTEELNKKKAVDGETNERE